MTTIQIDAEIFDSLVVQGLKDAGEGLRVEVRQAADIYRNDHTREHKLIDLKFSLRYLEAIEVVLEYYGHTLPAEDYFP